MRLLDVDTWELVGFQNELICHFILAADMVGGGIWEFVNLLQLMKATVLAESSCYFFNFLKLFWLQRYLQT